jgi:outer membrane immunogenic protein
MRKSLLLVAAAMSVTAAPALAQDPGSNVYGTIGYSQLDGADGDLGAITGRLGTRFTPNLGVEGEVSVGVRDDDVSFGGVTGSLEHKYDAAAYVVGAVPVSDNLELFARGGYGTTEVEAEVAGFNETASGQSWNYGVGANWYFDGTNGLRADWTRRDFEDDGGEADVYSLNYVRRF